MKVHPAAPRARSSELAALLDAVATFETTDGAAALPDAVWAHALLDAARDLVSRPSKRLRARLVELAFRLAGGQPGELSPLLPPLPELLHAGSLIIDDIQDGSTRRRGAPAIHVLHGVPRAINTGTWLYFAAARLLDHAGLDPARVLAAHRQLTVVLFRAHQGQALDLAIDVTTLARADVAAHVDTAATLKTGELMRFCAELGALAAGAPPETRDALGRYGAAVGLALQQLDDLGGLCNPRRRATGREDLAARRLTFPWALIADQLDADRFRALQDAAAAAVTDDARDAVMSTMASATGLVGRQRIAAQLEEARRRLAEPRLDPGALAELDSLVIEMERHLG